MRTRSRLGISAFLLVLGRTAGESSSASNQIQIHLATPSNRRKGRKGKAQAFYIRSGYLRTLIVSLATTEKPATLDSYFASMAKPATSMDIPTDAVTYLIDDPSHAIEAGDRYGIKMLSAEEARRTLPHFGGLGANLTQPFQS